MRNNSMSFCDVYFRSPTSINNSNGFINPSYHEIVETRCEIRSISQFS